MSSAEQWKEVGAKLEAIGLKLKLHYEQEHGERDAVAEPKDAVTRLADAVDDAFDALGNAATDDAVKADVRDAGQALSNALAASFAEVSSSLKRAFDDGARHIPVVDETRNEDPDQLP